MDEIGALDGVHFPDYWNGLRNGELRVPRCVNCEKHAWPPRAACPRCHAPRWTWESAPPIGRIYSWTVVGRSTLERFADRVPYVVAVIALDGLDLRVIGFVSDPESDIVPGMVVRWAIETEVDGSPRTVWSRVDA